MSQRDHDRSSEPQARSLAALPRRSTSPVLALQRALGNRGKTRLFARKGGSGPGTFENSVRIGKLGPIEIIESNIHDHRGRRIERLPCRPRWRLAWAIATRTGATEQEQWKSVK
jgi:hypothetical protein